MIAVTAVLLGAALSVLAFPPFGPGWLILPGIALFLFGLRKAGSRKAGLAFGALYGLAFFAGLMWWLTELGLIAAIPLMIVQGSFFAAYGWWLTGYNDGPVSTWYLLAVGGWGVMELIRYHLPVGGLEWGGAGYALSDSPVTRFAAAYVGTTGLTIVLVAVAAVAAASAMGELRRLIPPAAILLAFLGIAGGLARPAAPGIEGERLVVVVQGSTPCPFEHCPPNERLRTFEQHLELTREIDEAWLVVWSEGSTGSFNADPVLNPEIGRMIGEQARRLGAWFLVGSDRPVNDEEWVNANVLFAPDGEIVDEYRKQHPVPFGEYIPIRPLFEWIPALAAVPRDMIPGDGPTVFDLGDIAMGSVISFEGGFSRYAREQVRQGADFLVVATNEASYGTTPASDQFIGMTRMRAVENRVPVIHSAVTGRSVIIDARGGFISEPTGLGTEEVVTVALPTAGEPSPYARLGDLLMWVVAVATLVTWWQARRLVGSEDSKTEEE